MGYIGRMKEIALYPSIFEIPLDALKGQGVRALLIDLDGTLLPWNSMELTDEVVSWAAGIQRAGFKAILVSNNHPERVEPIAQRLGFYALCDAGKPLPRAFLQAAGRLGEEPMRCAVIGDQMMTDMLGAAYLGMRGILVNPMPGREFLGTKINRVLEAGVMACLGLKRPQLRGIT